MRILAFDSYYKDGSCLTIGGEFSLFNTELDIIYKSINSSFGDYKSGEFYKRELPGIVNLIQDINLESIDLIIIDGYVLLDESNKLGLGGHLFYYLHKKIPVIGVAKSRLLDSEKVTKPILRGNSKKPLYISSLGIDIGEAAGLIENLEGINRIPDALKKIDTLSKTT